MSTRYVVCYDVADDRRRRKLAELLDGYGDRVQSSVFEMVVEPEMMEVCAAGIGALIEQSEDHVAVYRLCGACSRERSYFGAKDAAAGVGEELVFIV